MIAQQTSRDPDRRPDALRLMALASGYLPSGGSMVNISSLASVCPSPHTVTRAASQELGPMGIRVNAIVCGTILTDTFAGSTATAEIAAQLTSPIPLGRVAEPDEVVGTAIFLPRRRRPR